MSIYALKKVWELGVRPLSKKLVLLALADHLNEESGRLDPSLRRLAERCGLSEKQVRRYLRELQNEHIVEVTSNSKGGARPCSYSLNLTPPTEGNTPLPPKGATPPMRGNTPLPPKGTTPPTGGSRIGMNLQLQKSDTNLSLNQSDDERETVEDEIDYQWLTKKGWIGRREQAQAVIEAYLLHSPEVLVEALSVARVKADSWPKCTSWLIKNAEKKSEQIKLNQKNEQPPGKNEGRMFLEDEAEYIATLANQKQSRKKIAEAFATLHCEKIKELRKGFENNHCSSTFKDAQGLIDWSSSSAAFKGSLSGWLAKTDPQFYEEIAGNPPTVKEDIKPRLTIVASNEETDEEINKKSEAWSAVQAGMNEARAKFGGAT